MVWYSHLIQNFPQFIVIHTVKGFGLVKLKIVKQEMSRVDIDILGINEIKWTEIGEFNSDDHYICNYGQDP